MSVGFGFGYPYCPFYQPVLCPSIRSASARGYPFYGYPGVLHGYPYPGYYGNYWASARLEVKPRDAQVYVDGYYVGVVDEFDGVFQRLDLPTASTRSRSTCRATRPYRQKTLFRPGESYNFKAMLSRLAAGAPEEPEPQPTARGIRIHRRAPPRGSATAVPDDPNPRSAGARPPARTMPRPERPRDRPGIQSARRNFGTLNVRVQPGDAIVVIDGERWDSPEGGSRLSVQLAAGHAPDRSAQGRVQDLHVDDADPPAARRSR